MLPALVIALALFATAAHAPDNPSCSLLTAGEAASVLGAGGTAMPIVVRPSGSSCLIQNGDKTIVVTTILLPSDKDADSTGRRRSASSAATT
ncbi:MAG: hypothetical protein R2712_21720 [Vicinamibacterales bacterium]